MLLLRALALIAGITVVLATWQSIIVTIILPRRSQNAIAIGNWIATYRMLTAIARRTRHHARRDAILALLGPLNIIGLLATWMALLAVGFGFVMWGTSAATFWASFDVAGSSIFTLGFATGSTPFSHILMDVAAASGMIVVALQIGYLPTIYGAYSQRESLVTLLNMRCANSRILTGAALLHNHPLPTTADILQTLFASWEASAAAIIESHTSYPWLIAFRSPRASESWVTSILAVLDAIAILAALSPSLVTPEAEYCRFACTVTFRELSGILTPKVARRREEEEPLTRETFVSAVTPLLKRIPSARDPEAAWPDFCAARAAYEPFALELAAHIWLPVRGWLRPVDR